MHAAPIRASLLVFGLIAGSFTTARADDVSPIIYLNRCQGGCTIYSGGSNSHSNTSPIPRDGNGTYPMSGFAHDQQVWDDMVQCVREVYAPYGAEITDVEPAPGVDYHEVIVAGHGNEIGWGEAWGVASNGSVSCEPVDNAISFAFANDHPPDGEILCVTVAQESGHTWGLDHEFSCATPMTYLGACGRQYFRNAQIPCGEFAERPCMCSGATQNSHIRLLTVFGPGQALPTPTVTLTNPQGTTVVDEFTASASAQATRGLGHAELWLNGYKWAEKPGNFRSQSMSHVFTAPPDLPDGVIDVEIRAFDDLEVGYGAATTTVTKGAPCTSADSCLAGQLCGDGKCYWNPPTGAMGEACAYPQFCTSGVCAGEICTESCTLGVTGDCTEGYRCLDVGGGGPSCQPDDGGGGGGGCAAGPSGAPVTMLAVLSVLGLITLSRKTRRSRK